MPRGGDQELACVGRSTIATSQGPTHALWPRCSLSGNPATLDVTPLRPKDIFGGQRRRKKMSAPRYTVEKYHKFPPNVSLASGPKNSRLIGWPKARPIWVISRRGIVMFRNKVPRPPHPSALPGIGSFRHFLPANPEIFNKIDGGRSAMYRWLGDLYHWHRRR